MSLNQYSKEQIKEMALIDVAYELLKEKKEPVAFNEIMDEVAKLVNLSEDQVKAKIAQFYTDLNIDGRFIGLGDNRWGLRVWYPVDQYEEEVVSEIKPKKKKAKKSKKDEDLEDFDELDEEDIDYDDIDGFEDEEDDDLTDDTDDDDLLDDDEDLDEDFEDDDDAIDKDEEYDLGDDDEELEEDELDEDEEDED